MTDLRNVFTEKQEEHIYNFINRIMVDEGLLHFKLTVYAIMAVFMASIDMGIQKIFLEKQEEIAEFMQNIIDDINNPNKKIH